MKYIKRFNLFKKNENFEINDSDKPDVKMSKEKLNNLKRKMSEYNSKKASIDNLYKSDKVESYDLEKIVGEEEKNEFLVSYANIVSMEKRIDNLKEKESKKAIELSSFKDRLSDAESDESKKALTDRVNVITSQISEIKEKIIDLERKLPELEKEHKLKMSKIEDDMKNWINKIQ